MQQVYNTYKKQLNQTLDNAWDNDAILCKMPLANDNEV